MQTIRTPMRDGIVLVALLWQPETAGPFPAILLRTPYEIAASEYARLGFQSYVDSGYAVVLQQVRGCGESDGEFGFLHQEGKDGFDSIEWIAAQPWSNGRVAMDGGSYLGTAQWLAARERPPHLVCIAPSVPAGDYFNELPYKGGALHIDWATSWLSALAGKPFDFEDDNARDFEPYRPLSSLPEKLGVALPLLDKILSHPTLDDYWREIYFDAKDFENIEVPVMTVTGWFDGDQAGSLFYWQGLESNLPQRANSRLIIGPWGHAECYIGGAEQMNDMHFGSHCILPVQARRLAFFDRWMKPVGASAIEEPQDKEQDSNRVELFITGSNKWLSFRQYPPVETQACRAYLTATGISMPFPDSAPTACLSARGSHNYCYDPTAPLFYRPGAADYPELKERDDVLLLCTEELANPVTVLGKVRLELFISSDAPDTDFVGYLLDATPAGKLINLSHIPGVMRARYRQGFSRQQLLTAGDVAAVGFNLADVGHCFLPGHRIAIAITSSCFPLIDPNTNTGADFRYDTETRVAHQRVHFGKGQASALSLSILPDA